MRSDRSNRYTAVPQAVSDEDEGVYDESPESSQHAELLSMENLSAEAKFAIGGDESVQDDLHTLEFCRPSSHKPQLPLALVDVSTVKKHPPMSWSRKFCFVLSVCVSVSYMIALLWLIPCNLAPCLLKTSRPVSPLHLKEWNRTFPNLRFVSEPQPVKVGPDGKAVLLLAFRLIDPNTSVSNVGKVTAEPIGGVIALKGDSGDESWRHYFYTDVLGIICDVTDVDRNTVSECAIVGSTGLLAAINASNGYIFWYLHDHDDQSVQISAISAPCPLPKFDLDQDGIDDLAVIGLLTYDEHRVRRATWSTAEQYVTEQVFRLLLVSGGSGQIIGQPVILPIAHPAQSSFHGYNRLPALFLYDLGNNSKSLLVFWGNGDGNFSNLHNNPGIIITAALEQVHANATRNIVADGAAETIYKDVYRGTGNLQSVTLMENGKFKDLLILGSNAEELICLGGSSSFLPKWVYKVESGFKINHPVLGSFNKDHILDVFITVLCVNCSSNADGCRSEAVIIDGKDGKEITKSSADCMALKPFVVAEKHPNMSTLFLFEAVAIMEDAFGSQVTDKSPTLEVMERGDQSSAVDFNSHNSSAAVILFDAYQTRRDETNIWNDIRNYGIGNNLDVPVFENDSLLGEIERMELDKMHSVAASATSVVNGNQLSAEKASASRSFILRLSLFCKGEEVYPRELNVHPVASCCEDARTPLLDTIIQGENIMQPYFISIQETTFNTVVTTLNLGTRFHSTSSIETGPSLVHQTTD